MIVAFGGPNANSWHQVLYLACAVALSAAIGYERELRGKLLRLRQGYAAAAGDEKALGQLAAASSGTILVLLRSLLILVGRPVPATPAEVVSEAAALVGAPTGALLAPLEHRGVRGWRWNAGEFEQYLNAVALAVGYVDQLQLGDQ